LALGDDLTISADEGSAVWLAEFNLPSQADYAGIAIGDDLTLVLWGTPTALICDAKRMARGDDAPTFAISGISPVAALGNPWALPVALESPGTAKAAVEALVGPVTWQGLPDWALPPSVTAIEATPLEIARKIVAAAGGLLESGLDGGLIARHRYPVSAPDYPEQILTPMTDRDLLGHSDSADGGAIQNRFIITSGEQPVGDAIQLEADQDPDDPHAYTVRAYPWPWRAVSLVHTGDAATQIGPREQSTVEIQQLIEVEAGAASLSHPAYSVISAAYQYQDLGQVQADGTAVTTATQGFSQIDIRYHSRAWEWRVTNARTETIQFLAIE
jgi:hypothetical protein